MKRIRIAQIGTNGFTHAAPTFDSLLKNEGVFEFVGLSEPNEEWVKNLETPRYASVPHRSVEEILALSPDAVAIETNEEDMTHYATLFAEKGIAVHMDKPGSADHGAFCRLAETLKAQDLPFHLGYMYRYNPLIQKVIALAEAGELGEILSVEAHMSCHLSAEKRMRLGRYPGGEMFYLGCHLLDLVLRLQGEPDEVIPYHTASGVDGVSAKDTAFAVLRYPKGVSFVRSSACEPGGFARRTLLVLGEEGSAELCPLEKAVDGGYQTFGRLTTKQNALPWADGSTALESPVFDRYDAMMLDFARQVRGEKERVYTPDYEVKLHKLLLSACGEE